MHQRPHFPLYNLTKLANISPFQIIELTGLGKW